MTNESLLVLHYLQVAQDIKDDQENMKEEDQDLVFDCTHYTGRRTKKIPPDVKEVVWTGANGFGVCDLEYISEVLEWDWSHIRDSDSAAVSDMARYLRETGCDKL